MGHIAQKDMDPFSIRLLDETCQRMVCPTPVMRSIVHSFLFLMEGEVLVESEQNRWLVGKGDLVFVPQNVPFQIVHQKNCRGFMGGFHSSFIGSGVFSQQETRQIKILQGGVLVKQNMSDQSTLIQSMMERIFEESQKRTSNMDLIKCYMMGVIAEANAKLNVTDTLFVGKKSDLFLQLLFDESSPVASIDSYADQLKVSPLQLTRMLKKETGKSANQWLEDAIILRSKALLCESELSVSEIAEQMGVLDQSYFSRKFKKISGCTPLEYRARYR